MQRPQVVVTPRRRRGRPSLADDSGAPPADVHLTLPADEYDAVYRLAQRGKNDSVQDVIRRALKRWLMDERGI